MVIEDVRDARPTAEQALGGLADEAGALMTDGRVRLWIEPPPADLAGGVVPAPAEVSAVLLVKSGQVTRIQLTRVSFERCRRRARRLLPRVMRGQDPRSLRTHWLAAG